MHGQGLDQIRVVPKQIIRVADGKQSRDKFEMQSGRLFLHTLDIAEIARVHVAELGKLGIG